MMGIIVQYGSAIFIVVTVFSMQHLHWNWALHDESFGSYQPMSFKLHETSLVSSVVVRLLCSYCFTEGIELSAFAPDS